MNEKEIIGNFLGVKGYDSFNQENRDSTLMIALSGARKLTGRNIITGIPLGKKEKNEKIINEVKENRYRSSLFLGITSYLIILDLVGCVFKKKNITKKSNVGIIQALIHFSTLEKPQRDTIKSLRNTLAHNFGLADDTHIFSLSTEYENLIELPQEGNQYYKAKTKNNENYTNVNEEKLCELIESVYKNLSTEFEADNLTFKNGMDIERLKKNFTILS